MVNRDSFDSFEEETEEKEHYDPRVKWCNPHCLDYMTFVGKDVFAIAQDIHIIFFNYKYNTETVYVANNWMKGDGVDAVAGHRNNLFAFAEKVNNARIFVLSYPSFAVLSEFKDNDVNRYKGLCMMEGDLVAGFSGFPNYVVNVWCWRTSQRLFCIETGVIRRKQLYMASRTHMLLCQCWGAGLIVWEVARCYKKTFMLRRSKDEAIGWEVSEPPFVGVCWSIDGTLFAIDPTSNLYSLASDGVKMVAQLEWSGTLSGSKTSCICSFLSGVLIYGPDENLRYLRKETNSWKVVWSHIPDDDVISLVSNSFCDMATMWTHNGFVCYITGEAEDKIEVNLFTIKQRNVTKIQMIAPEYKYIAMMNHTGILTVYSLDTAELITVKFVKGTEISFQASPVDPLLIIFGEVNGNYGILLLAFNSEEGTLRKVGRMCLTHQIVSQVCFSPDGRFVVAAAMSAGHIFIFKINEEYWLTLVRYAELGRGLADCFLMKTGDDMRCFSLVLFSEKYSIGERIMCVNAVTGKDNKFAGKMQGPYARLLPLSTKDTIVAIPHLSKQYHILKLTGDKGLTVSVKMGPIIESGHAIKQFDGFRNTRAFLTFGYDGTVILREPDAPEKYSLKVVVAHRYEDGVAGAVVDADNQYLVTLGPSDRSVACLALRSGPAPAPEVSRQSQHAQQVLHALVHRAPHHALYAHKDGINKLNIIHDTDKNYLDLLEEKKVQDETKDYKRQRDEVLRLFDVLQTKLVDLLEENLAERPLHQLSLAEFNLHLEAKKERLRAAERDREDLRLQTEARIRAQDKVTAWIKSTCWDTMLTPRIKLFSILSHYHVENFAILPTQREKWAELEQIEALRSIEMENDDDLFRPWEEPVVRPLEQEKKSEIQQIDIRASMVSFSREARRSTDSAAQASVDAVQQPHVLSGSSAHEVVPIPPYMIPQTLAFSFLQMNWLHDIVKLNVQNVRLWFNKQFDELMTLKKREVGLVAERNARLRFIIEELNKLSDLRGSFHHLKIEIKDPEWKQEEQPIKLIKVDPEECSIEPYVSPSQIVLVPPDPGPKDDFRERALMDMMDGVLEKLWHEEIKKPIPMPQCMLDKDPENFNEDDLRLVFDYEAKVAFRNEERDKYRKMLHAEYAKLSQVVNEGIVKFNQKVRDTWLLKLKVDSVIGQENLNLMRLRRVNLDRVEDSEKLERLRDDVASVEQQLEVLNSELVEMHEQYADAQSVYEGLMAKDKNMDKAFKSHFLDLSPIIVEQAYKFYKKRPKWHQRTTMIPVVLHDLALAISTGIKPALLHPDCFDYFKNMEVLDMLSNMPTVMDEGLWLMMCRLRRSRVENEIRMRALVQEMATVDNAITAWHKAVQTRRNHLHSTQAQITAHREYVELTARNKTIQLVLPAGQVEIVTTGHIEDFEDATLIPREDVEKINNLILKVGAMKLRMMRRQMEFRKGILAKEWEHAQMKMKLRHMKEELYSYTRLRIPKELQLYLKNKELGYTDEQDYMRMEKEMEASKGAVNKILNEMIHRVEELEIKLGAVEAQRAIVDKYIVKLNVMVSEKKLNEDALEPIRIRRVFKKRMETLVMRSKLIRDVQANHSAIVLLQTELELLRLKTYPTLASFRTY